MSPLDGVNGARRNLLARIGLSGGRRVSGARGRSERNCARSGQTAGGTPLLESFDVRVGEQQCAMRNVGFARLIEHEAQDVLDLRRPPRSTSRSIDVAYRESRWENVSSHDLIKPSLGA